MDFPEKHKVTSCRLNNGMMLVVKHLPIASVFIEVIIAGGSLRESDKNNGISHLLEHLIGEDGKIKEKEKRPQYKIERFGGEMNGYTSEIDTSFSLEVHKKFWIRCLKLLLECIFYPKFSHKDVLKERAVVVDEIVDADENFYDQMTERLFANHPLSRPVLGKDISVQHIGLKRLMSWHKKFFLPSRTILIVVGDVDIKDVKRTVEASVVGAFEDKKIEIEKIPPLTINYNADPKIKNIQNQTLIMFQGPPIYHYEDSFYFKLISTFFDDTSIFSPVWNISRPLGLYNAMRIDDELILPVCNFIEIYLTTSTKKLLKKLEERFWAWIRRVGKDGLSEALFLRIKRLYTMKFERDVMSGEWWINLLSDAISYGYFHKMDIYLDPNMVSKEKIEDVFRKYISEDKCVIFRSV
ncbi:MAG: hypothetical protein COU51_00405 [Parcubacteria group bacterium CG10_big_fil_rev_8_21_14_0_10_36_14]|nr:MAG: hypothetical protein COU51_00405 [Parcubacteria group bacterium CG10_big_fil_rev_8_21_14_0_10_36_14]